MLRRSGFRLWAMNRIGDRSAVDVDLGFIIVSRKYEHIRAHGIFSQLQYRVYPWKQRRSQPRPFVGLGLNCVYGWKDVNLMTGNRGWEIEKETILLRQWRLRPSLMIGLKVNIPFGLTFEATAGVLLAKHDDGRLIYHNLDMVNYVATQMTIRVGWSFDGKRHTKALEPYEEPAVEMEN